MLVSLTGLLTFETSLHNVFKLIPAAYFAHYVVAVKLAYAFFCVLLARRYSSKLVLGEAEENAEPEKVNQDNEESEKPKLAAIIPEDMVISLPKAFAKLAFSAYMINCYFVRFDFFTSRLLYVVDFYNVMKRAIYTIVYSFAMAVGFHLYFVAPFESLRRSCDFHPIVRKKQKKA